MVQQFAFRNKIHLVAGCHGLDGQSDMISLSQYSGSYTSTKVEGQCTLVLVKQGVKLM